MFEKLILVASLIGGSLLAPGISEGGSRQEPAAAGYDPSQTIVRVSGYVITVKDLEQIIHTYPEGSFSSKESRLRLVESLITTKLFALAARSAKLDAAKDFPRARTQLRQSTLAYAYFWRHVRPKFSEEEARKYFAAHKDEFQNFSYSRNQIINLLRDQALGRTNQALMEEWRVKRRNELLKDLGVLDPAVVLAQIGDSVITAGDLREIDAPEYEADLEVKLDWLVLERLYASAAEKTGLVNDPEVQKTLELSEDHLLARRYRPLVESKLTLVDARQYYETHSQEFKRPDQIRLRQIVVATQEAALAVRAKLDSGTLFEELARDSSIDRVSAPKGGDLGWVRKGRLYLDVENVAFRLERGQLSQPIRTPDGYVIVLVEERLEGEARPFPEVGPNLLFRIKARAVEAERQRLLKTYNVSINEKLLN